MSRVTTRVVAAIALTLALATSGFAVAAATGSAPQPSVAGGCCSSAW